MLFDSVMIVWEGRGETYEHIRKISNPSGIEEIGACLS